MTMAIQHVRPKKPSTGGSMKAGLQIARDQSVIDVVIEWRDRMPSVYPQPLR